MGILSGVVSYLFGLALNLLDAMINGFLGALGFDLDTFESYFPAAKDYYDVIIGFAVGLLFIILIFQLFRNFGVMLDMEAEEPLKMLGKTVLFYGMIINSRSITNFILKLLADPYAIFLNLNAAPDPYEFKLLDLVTSMFTSDFANPFMSVVGLILMLILGWQFLKLTIECVERYIVFYFVLYCAPVVFATGAFKSTAQVFKSWCRMLASQALLLLLNVWSIKLFISFMPVFEDSSADIIFNFLLGYAFLKFAQKADTLLRILGLNTASTGDMVRSLGGTIAGIAMTIKSMSGMAGKAAGKIFGGTSASGGGASNTGAKGGAGGNGIGGMSGSNPAGGGGSAPESGGVTGSGISAAKQGYVNEVLGAAKSQMNGNPAGSVSIGGGKGKGGGRSQAGRLRYEEKADGGFRDTENGKGGSVPGGGNIKMGQSGVRVDAETREGLANIAHGLPHDKHDPAKNTWTGGEFPEFTGENANLIGASELAPADGFEQHGVKMRDGSVGTLYQNKESGEAHLVQFGSVDNGVIQGTISEIDRDTGKTGDFMAFKAVHQSVPGAESFSGHSVPVADSEGGVYHVSTGAATSFFAPGGSSSMMGAPADSPAGGSGGSAASAPASAASGMGDTSSHHTSISSHEAGAIHTSGTGNPGSGAAAPVPATDGMGDTSLRHTSVSSHEVSFIHTSGASHSGPAAVPIASGSGSADSDTVSSHSGLSGASPDASGSVSVFHESGRLSGNSAESPPVDAGMQQPPNGARRFSKNNPANVEVFKRGTGGVESFDRAAANPEVVPKMGSPADK